MHRILALLLAAPLAAAAEPLTLDDALAEAGRKNLDLALAREDRATAAVDRYAAWSGVLPRLDVSAGFGRTFVGSRSSVNVVPVLDPATGGIVGYEEQAVRTPSQNYGDYQLGATLNQPLFDGFANVNRIEAARIRDRASERTVDEQALAVAFDVTRRFLEVVRSEESLRVLEETARRSEDLVGRADALFTAGRSQRADVVQAQVNHQNDLINVEQQRATVEAARATLATAIGREAGAPIEAVPPAPLTGALPTGAEPPPVDVLVARAKERRPLLAVRADLVSAAARDVKIARGGFWPELGGQLSYSRSGPELAGSDGVWGDPTRQYVASAQLVLSWNLFNGRETQAAVERAAVSERRARLQLAQAGVDVAAEIATARANVVAQARAARPADQAVSQAEVGVRLARERWEAGAATQLEVRDAELKHTQARLSLVSARVDHLVARADLGRATGATLE